MFDQLLLLVCVFVGVGLIDVVDDTHVQVPFIIGHQVISRNRHKSDLLAKIALFHLRNNSSKNSFIVLDSHKKTKKKKNGQIMMIVGRKSCHNVNSTPVIHKTGSKTCAMT